MWILLVVVISLAFKANASQISGHGSSTAEYGGNAHFSCEVSPPTGVLQVTWQRPTKDEKIENLATFNKQSGQQVNEPYKQKVFLTETSLNSSSITLTNVTWEDEGCYICAFNVYPDGSKRKQMCLTVQGISGVTTKNASTYKEETKTRQEEFSCSATGKPAPSILWDISPGAQTITPARTHTAQNGDRTFTHSSSITLEIPADWTGHVDCVMNNGTAGQRRERLLSVLSKDTEEKGKEPIALIVTAVIFISCIVAVTIAVRLRLQRRKSGGFSGGLSNTEVV